jgi:hypothetical protein
MNRPTSRIADLAARAEQGDERARRQLLQALAPALTRLAKAAVETSPTPPPHPGAPNPAKPDAAGSPLLRKIRAVAQRLTGGNADACDPAALAHDLGRLIAARIHPGPTEVVTPTLLSA